MSSTRRRTTTSPRRCTVVLAVLAILAACTDDAPGPGDPGAPALPSERTMLRVGVEAWPDCLNPVTCDSPQLRRQVLRHVLPVAFEVDAAGEYRPSPLLAAEPDAEVDAGGGMTITYELNPEAHWADGRPITSSDLRATWQAVVSTPGADTRGYELITEVDDEEPLVAEVNLSRAYGDWKELFGGSQGWVLKGDELGPSTDLTGRFEDELPFSAAPYRLASWDEDSAVLAAVDDYWDPSRAPEVDQVRFVDVDVDELVEPGAFDVLVPEDRRPGPAPENFVSRTLPTTTVLGVWFDRRTPLLQPLAHRQALAALVDRVELMAEATDREDGATGEEGSAIPCLGWLPGVGPWCEAAASELVVADPDVASYVLALEGWSPNEAGDLMRGPEAFTVPVSFDPAVPGAEAVADALVASFESVGIGADPQPVANRTWLEARGPESSTGVGVFETDLGVSPQVRGLYGCPAGPASNVLAWCAGSIVNPTLELAATVGAEDHLELVGRIGAVAAADAAWVPILRQRATSYVRDDRVQVPESPPAGGGPLAGLHAFAVDG